jgi:hypothetical protein
MIYYSNQYKNLNSPTSLQATSRDGVGLYPIMPFLNKTIEVKHPDILHVSQKNID